VSDEPLLSLRQVAEQLGRPVSSIRYYRDTFHDHVPVVERILRPGERD